MQPITLNRRHFLRGLGVCLGIPAFESLPLFATEARGVATLLATTATGVPLRTAFVFFPNGAIPSAWWPEEEGSDFKLSPTLQPLEPCREHVQVLGGLDHLNATPGPDGAGDHARGNAVFLTGVRLKKSATDIHAGISIDQTLARRIGHLTRLPSLELTCDNDRKTGGCDSGYSCAYVYNLSWSSPTTPMTPEANPRLVFERLFGAGPPAERAENLKRRQTEQRSVLDFVLAEARDMQRRLAAPDREKLDQYLTGVREIETRIQKAEQLKPATNPDMEAPAGLPEDYAEYVQLMYDLLVVAFQTDSTRVATFLLAHDGSNRSFREIGIPEGHHDLSHHEGQAERIAKVAEIDRWYVKQFARFLQKLEATKDVDGRSLLHNSMIVYGGGNADGNRHTHTNLPIILAGSGGGTLNPGRYSNHRSKPATNLFLGLAERLGLQDLDRFGDSTGRLGQV
jgi:BMFP domain-containing protein YqiC